MSVRVVGGADGDDDVHGDNVHDDDTDFTAAILHTDHSECSQSLQA